MDLCVCVWFTIYPLMMPLRVADSVHVRSTVVSPMSVNATPIGSLQAERENKKFGSERYIMWFILLSFSVRSSTVLYGPTPAAVEAATDTVYSVNMLRPVRLILSSAVVALSHTLIG